LLLSLAPTVWAAVVVVRETLVLAARAATAS
jgi:hypothetical protein